MDNTNDPLQNSVDLKIFVPAFWNCSLQLKRDLYHFSFLIFLTNSNLFNYLLKGLLTMTATMTTAPAMEEWITLDLMEVFTWRPVANATSTHRVKYNPFFPLPLLQSVWTSLKGLFTLTAAMTIATWMEEWVTKTSNKDHFELSTSWCYKGLRHNLYVDCNSWTIKACSHWLWQRQWQRNRRMGYIRPYGSVHMETCGKGKWQHIGFNTIHSFLSHSQCEWALKPVSTFKNGLT